MKYSRPLAVFIVCAVTIAIVAPVSSAMFRNSLGETGVHERISVFHQISMRARVPLGHLASLAMALVVSAPSLSEQTRTTTRTRGRTVSTTGSLLHPATLHARAPEVYLVKFHTSKGDFTMKVRRAWSPLGADRFYNLVEHHFYDGAAFFRVIKGFVVQFGINANPQISRVWQNANIKDDPVTQSNLRGYVTFATGGLNTRTTQVFINLADNSRLDSMGFSPFGQVIEGMDVVDQLYNGYGESPDQGQIQSHGKLYLEKNFPKLDTIITARVEPVAASHPVATPPKP
jgi:peptidyl-prolyl cis-trans isomerase A (cyclophilin A)